MSTRLSFYLLHSAIYVNCFASQTVISFVLKASLVNIIITVACLHRPEPISDPIVDKSCDCLTRAHVSVRRHAKDNYLRAPDKRASSFFSCDDMSPSYAAYLAFFIYINITYFVRHTHVVIITGRLFF